jgi:gliding motility-associated-like protein
LGNFNYEGCSDTLNCPSPKVSPNVTTVYTVYVLNEDSCIVSDTVRVEVLNQPSSFMPTAFTPNEDGLNDRFVFDILGAESAEVKVFDRWGNLLYNNPAQKNGLDNLDSWDGTFKGDKVEYETYVYMLKVKYFDGAVKDITGTIAIMR